MALGDKLRKAFNWGRTQRLGDVVSDLHGKKLSVGPTSGTPDTSLAVAHGLKDYRTNGGLAPWAAHVIEGNLYIVSVDATNVTVASSAATQSGVVLLIPADPLTYTGNRNK